MNKQIAQIGVSIPGTEDYTFYTSNNVSLGRNPFTENKQLSFVFAPFNNSEAPFLLFKDLEQVEELNLPKELPTDLAHVKNTSFTDYTSQFEKAQTAFKQGELEKVILSRILQQPIESSKTNPIEYFKKLCKTSTNTFNYIIYHPACGLWIGATPETLLNIEGLSLKTMALAGTRPANENPPQWRTKEREEQAFVSQFIEKKLAKYFSSKANISKTENLFTGAVWHLNTRFEQSFSPEEIKILPELIAELHPTPAISGMPKDAAIKAIGEFETHDRQYYTGYLGLIAPEKISLFVNLRCMRWDNKVASLFLGGGITAASKLKEEWSETEHKAQTLLKLFL